MSERLSAVIVRVRAGIEHDNLAENCHKVNSLYKEVSAALEIESGRWARANVATKIRGR